MSLLLALLAAQVGPLVTPGAAPPLPHQTQLPERRKPRAKAAQSQPEPARPQSCLATAIQQPAEAQATAEAWLARARGAERSLAGECLGVALFQQEKWDEASAAFRAARETAEQSERARLSAMVGNVALEKGDGEAALAALAEARGEATGEAALLGHIAVDRARALVMLKRDSEAETALAEARAALPSDPETWLLSATLSRRMNRLSEAQAQIEKASALSPTDPEVGLEAGLIAVLGNRDAAARKSWESVLATAPDSPQADTAKQYLAQLNPAKPVKP